MTSRKEKKNKDRHDREQGKRKKGKKVKGLQYRCIYSLTVFGNVHLTTGLVLK